MNDTLLSQLPVPPCLTGEQLLERGDTIAARLMGVIPDTLPPTWGVVLDAPRPQPPMPEPDTSMSWVLTTLLLCFVLVAVRFKNNSRYIVSLWKDMTEVRERRNIFDDTVRETAFLVVLNILWFATAAVLLAMTVFRYGGEVAGMLPASLPIWHERGLPDLTFVSGAPSAAVYLLFMYATYWMTGNIFSDSSSTHKLLRGYAATNGIISVCWFPAVLLGLCYPTMLSGVLIYAGIVFICGKLLFLYKVFRIFFTLGSSWVVFLYYICSLEIVPLILTIAGAMILGRMG